MAATRDAGPARMHSTAPGPPAAWGTGACTACAPIANHNREMTLPDFPRPAFGPLQRRLGLMTAIALVPLAVMAVVSVILSVHAQRENVLRSAQNTVRAVAAAIDADHAATLATLETLALSPRLQSGDLRGFHTEAHELLERRSGWNNIVLSNRRGQQIMNALVPFGQPLAAAVDREGVLRTIEQQKAEIGGVIQGPVLKQMTYTVRIPVTVAGAPLSLTAVMRPERIRRLLDRTDVPAPGLMSVVDASDFVVARSRDHDLWVGKLATESARAMMRGRESGIGVTRTLEGFPVVAVFQRSALTGWAINMGLPEDVIEGPATRLYLLLGGGIIASLLLGLVAAYRMSLTITRPVNELGAAARAMGHGRPPVPPQTPLPELRQVGNALAAAHEEREQLLERERESRRQAEDANRLKDEFLAMLGHELRNPLAAISNASQILDHVNEPARGGGGAPAEGERDIGREARDIIRRQAAHLGLLTDELADMARVMSGNILLERQPVDLAAAVRHTVETFRATGRLKEHDLVLETQPVWVLADPTRLEQIAANLITNAVKYTPPNGRIVVTVREEGTARHEAVFEVNDSGVGLEPDLLPRVFDLFVQGRRSLDRSQGGLGIGLTLVKRLVEVFNGSVSAHSDGAWTGSRFTVRLPAIEPPAAGDNGGAGPPGSLPRAVVIVEDNEDARLSLRALLELQGHLVMEAADGNRGIEIILGSQPDIALVDIGLPGADGYEVARRVRAELGPRIRLVAVSGYGQPEDKQKSLDAGFDAHLVKPVDLDALARIFAG